MCAPASRGGRQGARRRGRWRPDGGAPGEAVNGRSLGGRGRGQSAVARPARIGPGGPSTRAGAETARASDGPARDAPAPNGPARPGKEARGEARVATARAGRPRVAPAARVGRAPMSFSPGLVLVPLVACRLPTKRAGPDRRTGGPRGARPGGSLGHPRERLGTLRTHRPASPAAGARRGQAGPRAERARALADEPRSGRGRRRDLDVVELCPGGPPWAAGMYECGKSSIWV